MHEREPSRQDTLVVLAPIAAAILSADPYTRPLFVAERSLEIFDCLNTLLDKRKPDVKPLAEPVEVIEPEEVFPELAIAPTGFDIWEDLYRKDGEDD